MRRFLDQLKRVPRWGWWAGVGAIALESVFFSLGSALSRAIGTMDHAFVWKIDAIDDRFHVVPFFVAVYVFAYAFWFVAPVAASLTKRRNFVNYAVGLSLGFFIGFLFFAFMPTVMDRAAEGLMDIGERPGFLRALLRWLYSFDGGETAVNLFPSYHCLVSVYCYLAVRKQPEISKGFRAYSLVTALLICLSTLYTKQHYIPDVIGGVAIAVGCYALVEKLDPGKKWDKEDGTP